MKNEMKGNFMPDPIVISPVLTVFLKEYDGSMGVFVDNECTQKIGNCDYDQDESNNALITNIHLDGPNGSRRYVKKGLGEALIRRIKENHGLNPCFREDDGIRRDDGSHLTQDAPGFARAMIRKGLASWYP
jgi:hypothetical protein